MNLYYDTGKKKEEMLTSPTIQYLQLKIYNYAKEALSLNG